MYVRPPAGGKGVFWSVPPRQPGHRRGDGNCGLRNGAKREGGAAPALLAGRVQSGFAPGVVGQDYWSKGVPG